MFPTTLCMLHSSGDIIKKLAWRQLSLGIGFPMTLQFFNHTVTVVKRRRRIINVKQQPELKARGRPSELDARCLPQLHRFGRKSAALVVWLLQIKNDPYLIVSKAQSPFGLLLSLISHSDGCPCEG